MKHLKQLLGRLPYQHIQGTLEREISDVIYDSRKVVKDALFVCIKGTAADGHTFAKGAVESGAKALIVSELVDVPEEITVILVEDTRYALGLTNPAIQVISRKRQRP